MPYLLFSSDSLCRYLPGGDPIGHALYYLSISTGRVYKPIFSHPGSFFLRHIVAGNNNLFIRQTRSAYEVAEYPFKYGK